MDSFENVELQTEQYKKIDGTSATAVNQVEISLSGVKFVVTPAVNGIRIAKLDEILPNGAIAISPRSPNVIILE